MIQFDKFTFCKTDGRGYWSDTVRDVALTGMRLAYISEDGEFGELRVYFDTKFWDVEQMGLIYTDQLFEQEFKQLLASRFGFTEVELKALYYSEQGMQGNTYVSWDCETAFIDKFQELAIGAEAAA
jgi:hypothetical protein